jgi:tetratricopeptide (TPR) repeat protein
LALPKPPETLRYTNGMGHYARGLALAAKGRIDEAAVERDSVDEIADDISGDLVVGINAAKPILRVAAALLAGDVAWRAKKYDEAIKHYEAAVAKGDALKYDEPPAWYQPPRLFLGKALLDAGRAAEAEKVYREDLARHPNLGWTLCGLEQACIAQGKTREAGIVHAEFVKAWAGADVVLPASRF